jgi:hypothetical protein
MVTDSATQRAIERVKFDAENPYENVSRRELPRWWRENLEEFEEYGLHTYLPSRFEDGAIVQREIRQLEDTLDVDIRIKGIDVTRGDEWNLLVDSKEVRSVGKRRAPAGYTIFELTRKAFAETVSEYLSTD